MRSTASRNPDYDASTMTILGFVPRIAHRANGPRPMRRTSQRETGSSVRNLSRVLPASPVATVDDFLCARGRASLLTILSVESCGQCPPCKLESAQITDALQGFETEGDASQLARIEGALRTVADGNRCFLLVEGQQVVSSILRNFPEDVVAHEEGRCELRHDLVVPKIVDFDGRFRYDTRQARKRPDWTYAETRRRRAQRRENAAFRVDGERPHPIPGHQNSRPKFQANARPAFEEPNVEHTRPNENTRAAEEEDARQKAAADDMPTEAEEEAAERAGDVDEDVAEHYQEMAERGADQKGEGRLP
jgi:hypothetical protein